MKTRVVKLHSGSQPYWQVQYRRLFAWSTLLDFRGSPRCFASADEAVSEAKQIAYDGNVRSYVVWESQQ